MTILRRRSTVAAAANACPRTIVEFGVDPYGLAQAQSIANDAAIRLQGGSGYVYTGDKSDPSKTFYGTTRSMQAFFGASAMAANAAGVYRDPRGLDISTGVTDEGPFADPTRRILAQRLARRSP